MVSDRIEEFKEHVDVLVTIEIAVKMAEIEGRKVNKTIRDTWAAIKPRITHHCNLMTFDGLCKQAFPNGAVAMLRRHLDQIASE